MADGGDGALAGVVSEGGAERGLRFVGGWLGLVVVVVSGGGLVLTLIEALSGGATLKVWWAALFLAVVATGGAFAGSVVLGRFRLSAAMTLFVAGGTGGVSAPMMDTDLAFWLIGRGVPQSATVVSGVSLFEIARLMLVSSAALVVVSGLIVVVRCAARALPRLVLGGGLLAIPAAGGLALVRFGVPGRGAFGGGPASAALTAGAWALATVVAVLLVSVAVHLIINGFTIGIEAGERRAAVRGGGASPGG